MPLNTIRSLTYFLFQILGNSYGVMSLFTEFKLQMFVRRNFNLSGVQYYPLIICPDERHDALYAANTACAI